MTRLTRCLLPIAILLLVTPVSGQAPGPTVEQLVDRASAALKANRFAEAARACAAALKSDPMDARAQTCASGLQDKVQPLATAATALLGAGDVDDAHALCAALLVLNPTNADAQKCATGAGARIATRARERVKLEQAEGLIERGEVAQATKLLDEIATSDVPAHLDRAQGLQERLNDQAHAQVTASKRAEIARARTMISEGRRGEAATTLAAVIASSPSQDVAREAHTMMSATGMSWMTQFRDALKTPWLIQVLTGLVILAGLWLGLHLLRDAWRWSVKRAASRAGKERVWRFVGMGEDPVGARDAILDAIRRVPREVKEPIWTPTRLLLYPIVPGWEVWEDFAVHEKAKPIHEPSFNMELADGKTNQVLVEAFQNLQFSVGSISVAGVARLWTALVEWWQIGDPAVSGEAREIKVGNETKQVAIRLTASGCDTGTVSVMATTEVVDGLDAVAVSAERSAYKLLSRIGKNEDSAKQIDGHAAFRQGVTSFASCMRIVVDADSAKKHRDAALVKTIANLAFARETFGGDDSHKIYYLEATRLEALAYACIGRDVAARKLLDDLYDAAYGGKDVTPRHIQLAAESRYNQAILYWREAHGEGHHCAAALMASSLFDQVAAGDDEVLRQAAGVWQAAHLARMTRSEWLLLPRDAAQKRLDAATHAATFLAKVAEGAKSSDRRRYTLLASHARESVAIAELRYISAFELPCRGPFANGHRSVPEPLLGRVRASLESLSSTAQLEPLSTFARTASAYGLLLEQRWVDAEEAALAAVTTNAADQFAVYIAAEAAVQRSDLTTARKYLTEMLRGTVTEPALSALRTEIEKLAA